MANIRTARRSGRVFRGGKNVRESLWFQVAPFSATLAAGSTALVVSSLNAAALALTPFTVIRARGVVYLESDQTAAAESQIAIYAAAVVSVQAAAIGVTAVPTPSTDSGSDLFFVFQPLISSVGAGDTDNLRGRPIEIDSRAMRKVEDQEDLIEVVETTAASSGAVLTGFVRYLIKLH